MCVVYRLSFRGGDKGLKILEKDVNWILDVTYAAYLAGWGLNFIIETTALSIATPKEYRNDNHWLRKKGC